MLFVEKTDSTDPAHRYRVVYLHLNNFCHALTKPSR